MEMKWYAVHTYSGCEHIAQKSLQEMVKVRKMGEYFGDILLPSENVVEMVKGAKRTSSRKFFPGYLLVHMVLTDDTWHLVKGIPKITGFIGSGGRPSPISEEEVAKITRQIKEGIVKPKPRVIFEKGESVRVCDGPFSSFNGIVEDVKPEKGKVRVLVSIFGRNTPVELNFTQVEKN